jgi:hypothetical protein
MPASRRPSPYGASRRSGLVATNDLARCERGCPAPETHHIAASLGYAIIKGGRSSVVMVTIS